MRRALLYVWWQIVPPLSIRVSRRLWHEFAGTYHGRGLLRVHWRTLSDDEVWFLACEGLAP